MPKTAPASFTRPLKPDATLAAIVGAEPQPRTELVKRLWAYIKANGRQDATNRRQINADDTLRPFFNGADSVSMFQLTKLINQHLTKV